MTYEINHLTAAGEAELALETLQDIPAGSDTMDLATYEVARVWLEAGREGRGSRAYWSACGSADARAETSTSQAS